MWIVAVMKIRVLWRNSSLAATETCVVCCVCRQGYRYLPRGSYPDVPALLRRKFEHLKSWKYYSARVRGGVNPWPTKNIVPAGFEPSTFNTIVSYTQLPIRPFLTHAGDCFSPSSPTNYPPHNVVQSVVVVVVLKRVVSRFFFCCYYVSSSFIGRRPAGGDVFSCVFHVSLFLYILVLYESLGRSRSTRGSVSRK